MRHRHHHPEAPPCGGDGAPGREHRHGHRHGHGDRRHGRRLFDYGELRLLLLAMIAEQPRHGYELIKAVEERFAGAYSPSPGVIYPTLAWLDDMGYARPEPAEAGRKRYRLTAEGEAFLQGNAAAATALLARGGGGPPAGIPDPVLRAMENLKLALRLRLRGRAVAPEAAQAIAAAIDAAALAVERS